MDRHSATTPFPARINRLPELAADLWWSWHYQARDLFRALDYTLWKVTAHNPVRMLRQVPADRLAEAAVDPAFLKLYDEVIRALDAARSATNRWWRTTFGDRPGGVVAYFSAEFALHQSLPIYAGGLGVLAGDICKEASDLGIPIVGVGFMYPQGYFHQHVTSDGWQQEVYDPLDWTDTAMEPALLPDGSPCIVAVPLGDRTVLVRVWTVRAGRVRLFLLDTDLEENAPWDRELTARLYGGNLETRIQQEVVLGLGGVRALRAMGVTPAIWHLNEGHAAFVVMQRVREAVEHGTRFQDAVEEVRRSTLFTTHTPVPAGHDAFPFQMVEAYLSGAWGTLGQHRSELLALGAYDNGSGPMFNMTALALRTSCRVNAVSRLHQQVTRQMWAPLWGDRAEAEPPVRAITNGVHVPTWLAPSMSQLFERYISPNWRDRHDDAAMWDKVRDIPDEALWAVRQELRAELFSFIRERARARWVGERVTPAEVVSLGTLLDPDALTIGFARRFTAYKRPDLIFSDPERLRRILETFRRPVQIVFAGKAHPADEAGKHFIQRVYRWTLDYGFGGRVAFVDDYDLHVAQFLVHGCDVWLNTPRRPLEASGTSGMKAAINGVPHLSIDDGWWAEAYNGSNGWIIRPDARYDEAAAQDAADVDALYRIIEEQVVPAFHERNGDGIPHRWLRTVKESIRTVAPRFSARRMMKQYVQEMYTPTLTAAAGRLAL